MQRTESIASDLEVLKTFRWLNLSFELHLSSGFVIYEGRLIICVDFLFKHGDWNNIEGGWRKKLVVCLIILSKKFIFWWDGLIKLDGILNKAVGWLIIDVASRDAEHDFSVPDDGNWIANDHFFILHASCLIPNDGRLIESAVCLISNTGKLIGAGGRAKYVAAYKIIQCGRPKGAGGKPKHLTAHKIIQFGRLKHLSACPINHFLGRVTLFIWGDFGAYWLGNDVFCICVSCSREYPLLPPLNLLVIWCWYGW